MDVGEAVERLTRTLRKYYDLTGFTDEVFVLAFDNQGNDPVKFRVRIVCEKYADNKNEFESLAKAPFHTTIEEAVDFVFHEVVRRITAESDVRIKEADDLDRDLKNRLQIIGDMQANLRNLGTYQPPQGKLFDES